MDLEPSRPSWLWTAAIGTAAVCVALVGLNGREAQSQGSSKPNRSGQTEAFPRSEVVRPVAEMPEPSFERYRGLIRRNPFAPKLPPPVTIAPAPSAPPELPPVGAPAANITEKPKEDAKGTPPATAPTAPPDPLKDWTYTGTVIFGEQVYAVMENKTSKRGEYLKPGDQFQGAMVEIVAQNELRLTLNGSPRVFPKSSAFNATPLNAAPSAAPAGGPVGPGGPGGPGGPMPPGARPGGPTPPGAKPASPTPAAAPGGAAPTVMTAPAAIRVVK